MEKWNLDKLVMKRTKQQDLELPNFPDGTSPYGNEPPVSLLQEFSAQKISQNVCGAVNSQVPTDLAHPVVLNARSPNPGLVEHDNHFKVSSNLRNSTVRHGLKENNLHQETTQTHKSLVFSTVPHGQSKRCHPEVMDHINSLASKRLLHIVDTNGVPKKKSCRAFNSGLHSIPRSIPSDADEGDNFLSSMMNSGEQQPIPSQGFVPAECEPHERPISSIQQTITSHYFSQANPVPSSGENLATSVSLPPMLNLGRNMTDRMQTAQISGASRALASSAFLPRLPQSNSENSTPASLSHSVTARIKSHSTVKVSFDCTLAV